MYVKSVVSTTDFICEGKVSFLCMTLPKEPIGKIC